MTQRNYGCGKDYRNWLRITLFPSFCIRWALRAAGSGSIFAYRRILEVALLLGLHHIQLAMPKGGDAKARHFFGGVLGLTEVEKPKSLIRNSSNDVMALPADG